MLTSDQIATHVIPIFLKSCKDPVANVRLFTAKLMKQIIPKLNSTVVEGKVKPALSEMTNDADRDAQYFARQAIAIC